MELILFEEEKQTCVKSNHRFYKGAKGRFTSKVQAEIDSARAEIKRLKNVAEYYKNYAKRLEMRLTNERQIQTPPPENHVHPQSKRAI